MFFYQFSEQKESAASNVSKSGSKRKEKVCN